MAAYHDEEFLTKIKCSYLWTPDENSSTTLIDHADQSKSLSTNEPVNDANHVEQKNTEMMSKFKSLSSAKSSASSSAQKSMDKPNDWTLIDRERRSICSFPIYTVFLIGLVLFLCMVIVGIILGIVYGVINPLKSSTSMITTSTSTSTTTSTSATSTTTSDTTTTTTVTPTWIGSNITVKCLSTCINTSTTTPSTLIAYWTYEITLNDQSGNGYNGILMNGGTFVEGYIRQGIELLTSSPNLQFLAMPYINLIGRSFTVEAWIYLYSLLPTSDSVLLGQCESYLLRRCLHYVIRQNRLYLGFYGDDVIGETNLTTNVWYHVAFVYDATSNIKMIYLNGILDGISTFTSGKGSNGTYLGANGTTNIGSLSGISSAPGLDGRIDQLKISNRAKTFCEILHDATLIAHFPFDYNLNDIGPNSMTGTIMGSVSWIVGHVQGAISFSLWNSYFYSCNYYALGRNLPYSISLWINPSARSGTILHLSSSPTGSSSWCLPMIGFHSNESLVVQTSNGVVVSLIGPILPLNVWTHLLVTWSSTNGLRLYLNGELYQSVGVASFTSSGTTMCVLLANSYFGTTCSNKDISMGSFQGSIDEFYVFNRELSSFEGCTLSQI